MEHDKDIFEQEENINNQDETISEQKDDIIETDEIILGLEEPKKKRLTREQIVALTITIVVVLVAVAILVTKLYILPAKGEDNTDDYTTPVVAEIPVSETEESTTEESTTEETTQESTSDTITTAKNHKPYRADKNVTVHVASGNSAKDEDKGPNRVPDSSLNGNSSGSEIEEHNDNEVPPPIDEGDKVPPHIDEDDEDQIDFSKLNSFSSDYTNYFYTNTSNLTGWEQINGSRFYFDNRHDPLKGLQKIGGRNYYFNNYGANASKVGIDVSQHNGKIDWKKVKNDGIDYAIIRVGFRGYGTSTPVKPALIDKNLEANLNGASSVNMPVGLYFFSQAITIEEAVEEASLCVKYAKKYKITYPIYFDTEFSNPDRDGRADKLSKHDRTEIAIAFCETIKNEGFTPGIYASKSFYYDQLDYSRLSRYQIWVAHYTSKDTDFKHSYRMWQYTDKASVNGITGNGGRVDMNISYYDYSKKSDMKNDGKYIVMTNKSGVEKYKRAELAMAKYEKNKRDDYYNKAMDQLNALPNGNAKSALIAELKKMRNS